MDNKNLSLRFFIVFCSLVTQNHGQDNKVISLQIRERDEKVIDFSGSVLPWTVVE